MEGGNKLTKGSMKKVRRDDGEFKFDPVYHALSKINGRINKMQVRELKRKLQEVGLCNKGVAEVLRRRLKNYYKVQKLSLSEYEGQYYPRLIVLDFEATCEEENPEDYLHEIIEFPAVLVDTSTSSVIDEFHSFCKPSVNPQLSEFCTKLTGISQDQVDKAKEFGDVLREFESWLSRHNLFKKGQCAFVTDGCWDFSRFLNIQCCLSEIKYPKWAGQWINLKKIYGNFYKLKKPRITDMLSNMGLELEGRLHSGRDDARNMSRIVIRLIQDGAIMQVNEKLVGGELRFLDAGEKLIIAEEQARLHGFETSGRRRNGNHASSNPHDDYATSNGHNDPVTSQLSALQITEHK